MDIKKLIATLHPLERKVLPLLVHHQDPDTLVKVSGLKDVEVVRALQWLENKNVITVVTELKQFAFLEKNGEQYAKTGLPERKFIAALGDKEFFLRQLEKKASITHEELTICLGLLQRKAAIVLIKDKELKVKLTEQGRRLLKEELPEEKLLRKQFPVDTKAFSAEEKIVLEQLKKRKEIVRIDVQKHRRAKLTELGKQLLDAGVQDEAVIERLTPELIRSGVWKKKPFRRYDVTINVPNVHGGKFQPYRQFLEHTRRQFLRLGFTECTGPIVEQEFWNMDALFMPQFHSARDIHDAYFVKEPAYTKIDAALLRRVKAAHESGGGTGSKGWQYAFDEQRTQRNILRSHDTAISSRTLSLPRLQIPGKYFQIQRCFRHDVIDATHLPDFDQAGGFVIEEGLTLRHLFGLLRMFAKEFAGIDEVKIVPSYFPFTEPSCELYAKHPKLGWIELAGAGMFRPEMVKPLVGKEISVIAWGIGISRLAMFSLGINDVRHLFSQDIDHLRNAKVVAE